MFSATEDEIPQFSVQGLRQLCTQCPLVMYDERPDACTSNNRKKLKTASMTPANCLHIMGSCGSHQCHRTIAGKESEVIGDVFAAFITCTSHCPKLHKQLRIHLQSAIRIPGDPPLEFKARNELILKRTLLRRKYS
eukprot:9197860-Karenia_brevis.AAC.1